jgi:lysophospholipase L1-like esterase
MATQKNTIDFSRFVALGDSITAGYADGALYYKGQVNAYPNLIARQCQSIQPLIFRQALVDKQSAGIGFIGRSKLILVPDEHNPKNKWGRLSYLSDTGDQRILTENLYQNSGPFHNLSVPGSKAAHILLPGYGNPAKGAGNYNPFFMRMASDPVNTSVLQDALNLHPTFFTLLIGNNDILSYAMHGGTDDVMTPVEGNPGEGFAATLRYIAEKLTQQGAKGILATLPDLTTIPFFNTIAYDQLLLEKQEAVQLHIQYAASGLEFKTGRNAFVVEDTNNGRSELRLLTKGEIVLCEIMQDPLRMDYLSGRLPIPKLYYLTAPEIVEIKARIAAYNKVIAELAAEKDLGLVNLNKLLTHAKPDRFYDARARAIHYTEEGAFSLDGIHINTLGQALLANEFIRAIYHKYGTKIPRIPIVQFRKKHRISMQIK